jgi:transposase
MGRGTVLHGLPGCKGFLDALCLSGLRLCRWSLGTNLVEGINKEIKVTKRVAYGYREDAWFFLKIRPAFPGVG